MEVAVCWLQQLEGASNDAPSARVSPPAAPLAPQRYLGSQSTSAGDVGRTASPQTQLGVSNQ
jgi:hypothetical protein